MPGPVSKDKQRLSVLIEKDYLESVDKYSENLGVSRSMVIRSVLLYASKCVGIVDKIPDDVEKFSKNVLKLDSKLKI